MICFVAGTQSAQVSQLPAEKNQSADVQFIAAFKRIGFGTQRGLSWPHLFVPPKKEFFQLFFPFVQFKFLDKDEFRDVKRLTKVLLDGNQLSVVVDQLFRMQKSLNHLGASLTLYSLRDGLLKTLNCFLLAFLFMGSFAWTTLDLSYNRLAKVPNDSFLQLTNLTFLDLSYNKLVRLEPQSIRSLSNLLTLNISGNVLMDLREMRETFEVRLIIKLLQIQIFITYTERFHA